MKLHSVVLLSLLLGSATAEAQGLAAAAQKEKEKREAKAKAASAQESKPGAKPPETKVFTGDDLAGYTASRPAQEGDSPESGSGTPSEMRAGSAVRPSGSSHDRKASSSSGRSATRMPDDSDTRAALERDWRRRAEAARSAVKTAEKEVAAAQSARDGLGIGPKPGYRGSGGFPGVPGENPAEWTRKANEADARLRRAQAGLEQAKQGLDNFEEDARRQGALPGWLR